MYVHPASLSSTAARIVAWSHEKSPLRNSGGMEFVVSAEASGFEMMPATSISMVSKTFMVFIMPASGFRAKIEPYNQECKLLILASSCFIWLNRQRSEKTNVTKT